MTQISKYVSLAEGCKSQQAIRLGLDNLPTADHLENMKYVAANVFDRVREHFAKPIGISSFYRSYALNKAIGGSQTSQHCYGEAIDIDADIFGGLTNTEIFQYIKNNLDFDQLIWEFGNTKNPDWVHVSLKKGVNRRQVLIAQKSASGKTVYVAYHPSLVNA